MLHPQIRAVLFDCDGTLIDNVAIHGQIWPQIFTEFKLGDYEAGKIPSISKYIKISNLSDAEIRRCMERFHSLELAAAPKMFSRSNEVLKFLKQRGIVIAIVTNRPTAKSYFRLLAQAGLEHQLVDYFVNYDILPPLVRLRKNQFSVSFGKPDPRIINPLGKILKKLDDFPHSVLIVGDSRADLGLAQRSDFQFVGVLSGLIKSAVKWKKLGAKIVIREVSGLMKFFK